MANKRGDIFLDFLCDMKLAILNGRITPEYDNFTCITTRSLTVIDYMVSPFEMLKDYTKCEVIPITEYIHSIGLETGARLSDHSIIKATVTVTTEVIIEDCDTTDYSQVAPPPQAHITHKKNH